VREKEFNESIGIEPVWFVTGTRKHHEATTGK
jgi:hypothetical protein